MSDLFRGLGRLVRRFPFVFLIGAVVVGGVVFREYLSGAAADLRPGDCFDLPSAETDIVEDVQHRPCGEPHDSEVFLVVEHAAPDGAPYPESVAFDSFIESECERGFESYTGLDYDTEPSLYFASFVPSPEGWNEGDRKIICYAFRFDEQKVTGSLRAPSR
ncbi:MAG TPA: septum formation family protein [Candidatus Caenarcaniphilales bacterium]|nr:septum formation family protein [Candidatus Caenarcaniphilales bacterium]